MAGAESSEWMGGRSTGRWSSEHVDKQRRFLTVSVPRRFRSRSERSHSAIGKPRRQEA
jgi:hypothetical protein